MKKTTGLIVLLVIFVIFFGAVTFFMRDLLFGNVAATYEEAEPNYKSYSDKWISYEAVACLGCYAEETESYNFIPTGHSYYYMIWMSDGSIMPLTVSSKKDREYLDQLTDATYDYIDGKTKMIEMEPRTFIGTVETQKSEASQYYREMLNYMEIYESDGWVIRSVLLDCSGSKTTYLIVWSVVMLIPVALVFAMVSSAKKEKRRLDNPEMDYLPR